MIHIAAQLLAPLEAESESNQFAAQSHIADALLLEVVDSVCLKVSFRGQSITLDPRLPYAKPDIALAYLGLEESIELVWDSERFYTRDTASSVAERKGITSLPNYLFIVAFDGDDLYFITRKTILAIPDGVAYTPIIRDDLDYRRPRLWLASQHSALGAVVIKNKAKRQLLSQIKPEDSLAALEKQVDLLSALVVQLSESIAPNQRPLWLPGFAEVLGTLAATQFIGDLAAVADVQAHKTRMRALQAAYFAQRSAQI